MEAMPRSKSISRRTLNVVKDLKISMTVNLIPHPNPKAAINLIAEIVTKQLCMKDCEKAG